MSEKEGERVIRPALPLLLLPLGGLWLGLFCAEWLVWNGVRPAAAPVVVAALVALGLTLAVFRLAGGWRSARRGGQHDRRRTKRCDEQRDRRHGGQAATATTTAAAVWPRAVLPPLMAVAVGLALGLVFWTAADERADAVAAALAEHSEELHPLVIEGDPQQGVISEASVATLEVAGVGRLRVRVYWGEGQEPLPLGTRLRARVAFKPLTDTQAFLHQKGVFGSVSLEDVQAEGFSATPLGLVYRFREHNRLMLAEEGGDGSALLRGVLLGDTTELDSSEAGRAFKVTGLSHLVAVSGGHLVVIALLLSWLIGRLGLRRSLEVALIISLLVAYVFLTGLQPSAIRSCVMTFIASMTGFVGRRGHIPSALATAAVAMLLLHPPTAFSVGFWLSVYAVFGLTVFCPLVTRYLTCLVGAGTGGSGGRGSAGVGGATAASSNPLAGLMGGFVDGFATGAARASPSRLAQRPMGASGRAGERLGAKAGRAFQRGVLEPLALTTTAQMATLPITAPLFAMVSLVSPLANLLVAPLVTLLVGGGIAALCLMPLLGPLGPVALDGLRLIADLSIVLSKWCAQLPHACLPVALDPVPTTVCALLLAALVYRFWPQPSRRRVLRAMATLALTCVVLAATTFLPVAPQVVALDVGQGDAILIREGYRNILVDTGQNDAVLLRALARQGVSRLDAVIVTHLDDDHSGALDALGGTIPVEHVYFAAGLLEAKGEDAVIQTAQQLLSGKAPEELAWGDALRLGDNIALSVLWPDRRVSEGGNEESLCLGLSYSADGDSSPSTRLLLTGDAEAPQLEALLARAPVPDASAQTPTSGSSAPSTDAPTQTPAQGFAVLKVGHHGSKDAVTVEQLRRMGCVLALISVGRDNRYGHPAPDTLSVLDEAGVRVYRTDLNGDIRLRFDGGRLSVRCDTMDGQAL